MFSGRRDTIEFDAFLSHSSADALIVQRLHRQLERYRAPRGLNIRTRRLRVFHYHKDSPLSPSLKRSLTNRVYEIPQLVVAASPEAAKSEYVDLEIRSYLASHDPRKIFVALIKGGEEDAIPQALKESYPDTLYADLRGCEGNRIKWLLWQHRRMRRAMLPLLASLYGVERDQLIQRHRRRTKARITAGFAVIAVMLALLFLRFLQTPPKAWVKCPVLDGHAVSRVTLHRSDDGAETIRTLSLWNQYFISDVPDNPNGLINAFDENCNRVASIRYWLDAGGEGDIHLDWNSISGTTLDSSKPIKNMQEPPQLGFGMKGLECKVEDGNLLSSGEALFSINTPDFEAKARAVGMANGLDNPSVLWKKFFELPNNRVLAASYLYVGGNVAEDRSGTLIQITDDRGFTWETGSIVRQFSVTELVAISIVDQSVLHIGFELVPENPIPNALFESRDGGESWHEISLPPPISELSNWQLEDFAVSCDLKMIAISAVEYRSNPLKRLVMLSSDHGTTWQELSVDQPVTRDVRLAGVSKHGTVVGHFRSGGGGDRDLQDGDIYLWRTLSVFDRIRRMWF